MSINLKFYNELKKYGSVTVSRCDKVFDLNFKNFKFKLLQREYGEYLQETPEHSKISNY